MTVSPRFFAAAAGAPRSATSPSCYELVGLADQRAFALTGNSTSLLANRVSAINPRLLVFPRVGDDLARPAAMTAVGFVRGEQFVELASRDLSTGDFNFYLVRFEQKCNYADGGCDLASLLTEEIEHDWTAYSVYDQDDLEETSLDCNSCHQPDGHGTKRILRMQELASPWLHWFPQRFVQRTDSDRVLLAQFADTHAGDKHYGGIPIATIANALDEGSGAQLEALVRAEGFGEQPNPFDAQIVAEMKNGTSPTWEARFETHLQGRAIAVPYPAIDVTDEAKRNAAARSYQDVVRGAVGARKLARHPRDLLDGRAREAELRSAARRQTGRPSCWRCARVATTGAPILSWARADSTCSRSTRCRARRRTSPSRGSAIRDNTRMPPWRAGSLTPEGSAAAILELQK